MDIALSFSRLYGPGFTKFEDMFKIISSMWQWREISSEHGLIMDGDMLWKLKDNGMLCKHPMNPIHGHGRRTDGFISMASMSGDSMGRNGGGMRPFGSKGKINVQ
jgi:hypothetical protein